MDYYTTFSEFDDFSFPQAAVANDQASVRWIEGMPPSSHTPSWGTTGGSASIEVFNSGGPESGPGQLQFPLTDFHPPAQDSGILPPAPGIPLPAPGILPPAQDPAQEIIKLYNLVTQLKRDNEILDARYNVLFSAYNALVRRVPFAPSVVDSLGHLLRSDFSLVTFWFKQDWTEYCKHNKQAEPADPQVSLRGSARAHMGINVAMRYVQDRHGSAVDGHTASMIRALARAIWVELGICGAAPTTWKQIDAQSRDAYYRAMNVAFFELRLCDANWKAEQIATTYYSAWYFKWCEYFQTRSLALPVEVSTLPTAGPSTKKGAPSKRRKVKASADIVD